MLYKIIHDQDIFELNNGLRAIPEFADLTDRQMKCVALTADYDSPLRRFPEKERREQAAIILGWPMEGKRLDKNGRDFVNGKVESVEAAIKKYHELQYDEDKSAYIAYDIQIQAIVELMKEKPLDDKTVKLSKQLPDLREARQKLSETMRQDYKPQIPTYTAEDITDEENSDITLSPLDKFMATQKNDNGHDQ